MSGVLQSIDTPFKLELKYFKAVLSAERQSQEIFVIVQLCNNRLNKYAMESIISKSKPTRVGQLALKITRLRRRLLSYGWNSSDVSSIILNEFLKIGEVDWKNQAATQTFYELKDRYHIDSETAQLIMCLQNVVPNFQVKQVCQYLTSVLEFNSLAFGINLCDSSSDSNQDFSSLRINKNRRKWRHSQQSKKRKSQYKPDEKPRKKLHDFDEDFQKAQNDQKVLVQQQSGWQQLEYQNKKQNQGHYRKRSPPSPSPEEDKVEKKVKKNQQS